MESSKSQKEISMIYDIHQKPTCIEKAFGEKYHVKDTHSKHQISIRFVLVLMTVYMVQGARDSLVIATQYYLPAVFDIDPIEMENFQTIIIIPWTIKMIYGLITDLIPICGYKRKIYIIFFEVVIKNSHSI